MRIGNARRCVEYACAFVNWALVMNVEFAIAESHSQQTESMEYSRLLSLSHVSNNYFVSSHMHVISSLPVLSLFTSEVEMGILNIM